MNIGLGTGKLFMIDENGNKKEIGTCIDGYSTEIDLSDCIDTQVEFISNGTMSLKLRPKYKQCYKKRKGKRYVNYYRLIEGFNPEIIKKILGGE